MSDKDLSDILPDELFNHSDCFNSTYYARWEREVATPALVEAGYTDIRFYNVERDSFGPLIRGISTLKNGEQHTFYYG